MFSQACVKTSVNRAGLDTLLGRHTLSPGKTPPGHTHPHPRHTPPPEKTPTKGYGQQAGGMHPPGMHSCLIYHLVSDKNCIVSKKIQIYETKIILKNCFLAGDEL